MVEEIKGGCIRVQSSMNEWMDCLFLVNEKDKEIAIEVLKKDWDAFWEDDTAECYGEYLEAALKGAGIAFDSYYADDKQAEEYESLSSGMIKMLHKAEEAGWWWKSWAEDGLRPRTYVEMGRHSPAGEDFSMIIDYDAENQCQSFRDGLESYYEDFDVDEHIEMWIEARRNGTAGVPSIRELVEDAEAIEAMILELSQTLRDLEAESDNE